MGRIGSGFASAVALLAALAFALPLKAAERGLLFEGVHVFDGSSSARSAAPMQVLVVGNRIRQVSAQPIEVPADVDVQRIAGEGRTLMPGLIDAHWHSMLIGTSMVDTLTADVGYINLRAAQVAEATLLRGFTSVRDMGGPASGLRRAVEEGRFPGPRIFPSGAMISQTGGHGDFRLPHEVPRAANEPLSHSERMRAAAIADGADEVLRRAREQLMLGATQLKLMAGGGVASMYDPLDASQYTPDELRAAVQAAENWGTYVTVHAYTSRAVRTAIEAGVKCIEHGQLVDEDTVRLMAREGVWWSLQPFLANELSNPQTGANRVKQLQVAEGTRRAYALARKHKVKVAFGTDILFSGDVGDKQNRLLATLSEWYTPGEILQMATGSNGQLLALSGLRNPYPGPLGVIAEGAMADLLLVDGDPTADLSLIAEPERGLVVIVKDGRIHRNRLQP